MPSLVLAHEEALLTSASHWPLEPAIAASLLACFVGGFKQRRQSPTDAKEMTAD
jgi:hypothetical protein